MQSRAVAAARSVCARAPGVGVGGGRARTSRRGAATRSANAKNAPAAADAGDVASQAILKPRARGKHLDRPWHLTYLRNQGHGTPAQKAALRELWSTYGVDVQTYGGPAGDDVGSAVSDKEDAAEKKSVRVRAPPALDFAALFPELPPDAPATLEIGFGLGDSLVEMATKFPRERFLGAEVHKPGIGAALRKLRSFGIENVRVIRMDALWLLRDFVPDDSLADVCVYFPDPWSDQQTHRRIVNPFLLKLCERKMRKSAGEVSGARARRNARLHVSTDDAAYAEHVRRLFGEAVASGAWRAVPVDPADESYGADVMLGRSRTTKYELKGTREGRSAFDACLELLS